MTPRVDRAWAFAVAAGVLALGLVGGGAGFANGDAAAYAAQGWAGNLWERPIHLGWIAVAAALAPLTGEALPRALDAVCAISAALLVLAVARGAEKRGGTAWIAALAAAAPALPLASFAEVDVPWAAALAWAAVADSAAASAALAALACAISPTAILGIPWAISARTDDSDVPDRAAMAPALGALVAVAGLTTVSGGGWWVGDRGVLRATLSPPLAVAGAWLAALPVASLPLSLLAGARRRWGVSRAARALAWAPLLLAPADVPAWLPLYAGLGVAAGVGWTRAEDTVLGRYPRLARQAFVAALVLGLVPSGLRWALNRWTVAEQQTVAAAVAAELGPDDAVVAPFTWGARVSVLATRDPYGIRWRPPGTALRDQAAAWCAAWPERVAVLPPGSDYPSAVPDAAGVRWTRGDDPAWAPWRTTCPIVTPVGAPGAAEDPRP